MYLPKHFNESELDILYALMRAHPLACIVTHSADGLSAEHIPLLLRTDAAGVVSLVGHVARANPLAKIGSQLLDCLVIFQGTEHYISPNWYPSKQDDGKVVPTWNYSVVHVNGQLKLQDDSAWLRNLLEELTNTHEKKEPKPWQVADAPADYLAANLRAIVGIEIQIAKITGKRKLSQNKSQVDQAGIAEGLQRQGTQDAQAMAQEIGQLQGK